VILGLTEPEVAFILAKRDGPEHLMQPFLLSLLCEARQDLEWLDDILEKARARLPKIDITDYQRSVRLANPRNGPWDESVDWPALKTVLGSMAQIHDTFKSKVVQIIDPTNSKVAPPRKHPLGICDLERESDFDPKLLFINAMFGKLSNRSDPGIDLVTAPTGLHNQTLSQLVIAKAKTLEVGDLY
jgi:hypothetical protein